MFSSRVVATSLALISFVGSALGHGYTTQVTVDGEKYDVWRPWTDPYESPVPDRVGRKIANDGPITDYSSTDLACNKLGQTGQKITAKVAAGGKVTFQWTNWPLDHYGPVTTYMASCNGKCEDLDLNKAGNSVKWFKIDAKGYDSAAKRWASQDLIDNGNTWTSTVPSALAPGEYLIRNEIVALHSLPAQVYPACVQLSVTGSGNAKPSGAQTVPIPGVYDGYQWPYIWGEFDFKLAGPPVFGSGSSTGDAPAPVSSSVVTTKAAIAVPSASSTAASSTEAATTTEAAPNPTPTRTCQRRRSGVAKRNESAPAPKAEYYKRHGSRRSLNRLSSHH